MGNENDTLHTFTSVTEISNYLGISRPTYYRRLSALGFDKAKKTFSKRELKKLQSPLQRNVTNDNKKSVTNVNFEFQNQIITDYQKQISELHNLLDQQQKLTLDLQSRLDNKNQELLDLKETPKKGFWRRLFG
ncbi:NUMOD1 domain-containing DNA-binding protein [Leuconostoc mesenteroides]|uniref:NUMOD1 domain-containing DNA-binding protein n=1 Tax=Leuconostoc mesenteroides TaxID=1245 RepID=UPI0011271065|nr:NUMOD1 domain-containing DNA-binding protein [Leuconostoc mesenteroides]TPF00608.1 hypothetical protein DIS10_08925 [Leuconostoc mesenteroides]